MEDRGKISEKGKRRNRVGENIGADASSEYNVMAVPLKIALGHPVY